VLEEVVTLTPADAVQEPPTVLRVPPREDDGPRRSRRSERDYDNRPRRRRPRIRRDWNDQPVFSLVDAIPFDYVSQVNLGVGIGLLLQTLGLIVQYKGGPGLPFVMLGGLFFLWGCLAYAKNKGYSQLLGLFGLCGLLGLFVLVCLPQRYNP
jgi:hypothetical protein